MNDEKDKDEFQIARDYLLSCPQLKSDSPAIKAALEGISREEKRRIRDRKLRNKFGGNSDTLKNSNSASLTLNDEIVVVEKESDSVILEGSSNNSNMGDDDDDDDDDDDMEWQDVRQQQSDEMVASATAIEDSFTNEQQEEQDCFLGRTLAKATIDAIAEQAQHKKPVTVQTPLAAVAVALHVSLRTLGFACTGIPETKPCKGFAPPIRELPKSEFLPRGWTNQPLRYRKADTGALILTVQHLDESKNCKVTFCPQSSKETNPWLEFALNEHMNLDSWNAAKLKSDTIGPSLHYKNLSGLLSKFCRTFDLGAISEDTTMGGIVVPPDLTSGKDSKMEASGVFQGSNSISYSSSSKLESVRPSNYSVTPTRLDQAFPSVPAAAAAARGRLVDPLTGLPHGDFAGDLIPAGLQDPRFAGRMGGMPTSGGNLMGPNHPAFAGNFPNPMVPMGGPGTMQPRFDPIVPPCLNGGEDIPGTARRQRGEPNPDHLRPPNSLGNNMFM